MDSSSAGQERLKVIGRSLRPALDLCRLLLMMMKLHTLGWGSSHEKETLLIASCTY